MTNSTERQWHTMTVRFGTDGPLDASQVPTRPPMPQYAMAVALRTILGTDQVFYVDNVSLIRADVPR